MRQPIILLLILLLSVACAPRQRLPTSEPEPQAQTPEAPAPAPVQTMSEISGPAVIALLGQGEELAASGDYGRAAASVERALDLEPRNPYVYQRLARLRLAQGQPGQAETLARKSNSVGGDNPSLRAHNWALIAQARRARGDSVGGDAAASRAEYFRDR